MGIDLRRIYTVGRGTLTNVVLTTAMIAAARKLLMTLMQSGPVYVMGTDGAVHRCRVSGKSLHAPEKSWNILGPADQYTVNLSRLQLSPDEQWLAVTVIDPFDQDMTVVSTSGGQADLSGTDNILMQYFPASISANESDIPPSLAAAQAYYDTVEVPDGAPPVILTASASTADDGANGMTAYLSADNDVILAGTTALTISAAIFPPDTCSFWLRLRRQDGAWTRIAYGFGTAPPAGDPPSKLALALGAEIAGEPSRVARWVGSTQVDQGAQLLSAGKPLKLPKALASGVMGFTGPWT